MASTNDLKNGTVLNLDGNLWSVVEFQHVKPGKGGAFVRTKLKNVLSGKVVDRTFNAGSKVETATVDKRDFQYLYRDGEDFVFMDSATYDQVMVPPATVGDAANYLLENQDVMIATHESTPLYVELPTSVVLEITYTMGWTIERMPAVDRAALRIATWEILHAQDVPDHVAISEAVEIVQELSTDESPTFVNGLLARIAELGETLRA